MRINTSYNNFSRGQMDHDMMGRYDLPVYTSGSDVFNNFITNFKGNAIYRAGFMSMVAFQDCVMVEFKFNNSQQYLCLFYLSTIRFLSFDTNGNFGWVLNAGNPLEVVNPYTLAQCRVLDYTQNKDVMVVTHPSFAPYKLTRVAADNFTFASFKRLNDPFAATWQATKTVTAITQAATPLVTTSANHGYSAGDYVLFAAIVGMTQLNGLTGQVLTTPTATTFTIDINTTAFTAYTSGGTSAKVLTWSYPACCLFYKGRLFYAASAIKPTTVFMSCSGDYDNFIDIPSTDSSAFVFTIADIAQPIEWLFAGQWSLIAGASDGIVAINGGQVNTPITASTIDAQLTSAPPCNSVKPFKKDGMMFYVGLDGRNMYYFNYDIIQAVFVTEDANAMSYEVTDGGITKLRWKKDKNDLIFGVTGNGNLISNNFKKNENINGWHNHATLNGLFQDEAVLIDNTGKPQLFALVNRGGTFYIEQQAPYIEFKKRSTFFTEPISKNQSDVNAAKLIDDTAYANYLSEQLKQCIYLDNSLTISGLKNNVITFDGVNKITATSNVFASSDVGKQIVYKTTTGYESGRLEITGYTSATVVTVRVLQTPTVSTSSWQYWYKTFSTISGLSQYNGQVISVVSDGGYQADFGVMGGTINLDQQVTFAVVGYKYKGMIKSFCLGFQIQAENTQTTMKAISRFGIRTVASAGLAVGASPYKLEDVQELSANDLNYLPPLPMDGTKFVTYSDDHKEDKFFYVVQDKPLPATICSVAVEANQAIKP